jgi:hypothetical protein
MVDQAGERADGEADPGLVGRHGVRPGGPQLLDRLHLAGHRHEFVVAELRPELGEHPSFLVLDVVADLLDQAGHRGVELGVTGIHALEPFHGLLGLGVLLLGVLRLRLVDLLLHARVDLRLLGDRVLHQTDGHLVDQRPLALQRLLVLASPQALELLEDALELPVIGREQLHHVHLVLRHWPLLDVAGRPVVPRRRSREPPARQRTEFH